MKLGGTQNKRMSLRATISTVENEQRTAIKEVSFWEIKLSINCEKSRRQEVNESWEREKKLQKESSTDIDQIRNYCIRPAQN